MTDEATLSMRERGLLAVAPAARIMTSMLMGTSLAVFIGQRGSPFAVSMVMTAYFIGLMFFAPIWGAIADVTGRRRTVLIGTGVVATVVVLPLTVVDGVWGPIGLRALYAIFAAGFMPVMLSIVSAHGGAEGRGRSIGFFNSARAVGFTGAQLGAGFLLGIMLPGELFFVVAAISLMSTVAVAFLSDPAPQPAGEPTVAEVISEVRTRLVPAVENRDHLRTNGLQWLYVALALRNMTVLGVGSLLPPYLIDNVGVSAFVMGALLALNPGSQTVCMYAFGKIADAAGRKPLIVGGMAGSALYAILLAGAILPSTVLVRAIVAGGGLLLLGAAYSAMTTGTLAFIGDVAPDVREGELMGLRSTAKGVGGVLGPPLIGVVATYTSYELAFGVGSVLAIIATGLAATALVESRPTDEPVGTVADD
ncbi:MAG: MFS transporter [Halobacteriales archaeon]